MNELRRMAYLDALGIHSYVSRAQLPGAATTRRLAIIPVRAVDPVVRLSDTPPVQPRVEPLARRAEGERPRASAPSRPDGSPPIREPSQREAEVAPFSLTAIVAGDWLWLEELDGMPLATEQVQLVQSMAQALLLSRIQRGDLASRPDLAQPKVTQPGVAQFNWPIHNNPQLGLGAEAARASVAGFVARRVDEHGCRGLVLLGQSCAMRVPAKELGMLAVSTASSAEMLARPALKRQVWQDLLPLVSHS